MQFTLWTKNKGAPDSEAWPEEYNKPTDDPEQWATDTLEYFNSTRHPGELERVLVKVVIEANEKKLRLEHSWRKTNLVSLRDGSDSYRCEVCGATGRRYGLGAAITPDRKSQAQCKDTAASREQTDNFDKQVFDSYLRSREPMGKKKPKPVVREVIWTKRLRKVIG